MHGDVKNTLGKKDITSKGKEMGKNTLFSYKKLQFGLAKI